MNKLNKLVIVLIAASCISLPAYADTINSNNGNVVSQPVTNNNDIRDTNTNNNDIRSTNTNNNDNRNTNSNDNRNTNTNDNRNTNSNTNRNTANGGAGGNATSRSSSDSTSTGSSSSSNNNSTYNAGDQNVNITQLPTLNLGYEQIGDVGGSVTTISAQAYGGNNGGGVAVGIAIPLHGSEYKHALQDASQIERVKLEGLELQVLSLCQQMKAQQHIVTSNCAMLYQKYNGGYGG